MQNNPTAQNPLMTVPEDFAGLKLAPGFLLNVQVYDEPDLSARVRVDSEGNISLPFLKTLHVGGDTVAQTKQRIEDKFRNDGILKNPQITIDVEQFATTSVTVMGEVSNPGKVELLAPHSLLDVIGMTGGETTLAGNEVEVKRPNGEGTGMTTTAYHYSRGDDGSAIRDVMVKPGDTVIVKRAGIVYVLGGVNRPGGYAMQENGELNVAQAISLAQGLVMQAKVNGLRVVQRDAAGKADRDPRFLQQDHGWKGKADPTCGRRYRVRSDQQDQGDPQRHHHLDRSDRIRIHLHRQTVLSSKGRGL